MTAVLLVATSVFAAVDWWSRLARRDSVEQWAKPLTTLGVVAISLANDAATVDRLLMAAALVLCLVGDVALLPRIDRFVFGLGSFLVAHLVLVAAFARRGFDRPALAGVALVLAAGLVGTVGIGVIRGASRRGLAGPVIAYFAVISAMTVAAWATGEPWVIVGATAFVVSDTVLGWREFVRPFRGGGLIVMITYHGAIGALALSPW